MATLRDEKYHVLPLCLHTSALTHFTLTAMSWLVFTSDRARQDKMTFLIVIMRSTIASDLETYGKLHYAKMGKLPLRGS